jgi:glycosyltransferase involved in cell wall biosynthesis
MIKLSSCLILKNEGQTIYRCLDSVKNITDEYIIGIDKTCSDETEAEVLRFKEENPDHEYDIYKYDWPESFAEARNEGMDKATGDWILIMDGHEFLPTEWYNITEKKNINAQEAMKILKGKIVKDGVEADTFIDCDEIFLRL